MAELQTSQAIPVSVPGWLKKTAWTSDEVQQRREMMSHHALVVTKRGMISTSFEAVHNHL
jgi:hypothetical protein